MARPAAPVPGSEKHAKARTNYAQIFNQKRQIVWFALFVLWLCIDIAELGLVSQQIHERTRDVSSWPNAETQNAMGLLLFACIISLLFGLFHWAASLFMYHILFLMHGVFWGTGAGIIEATPFGHGLQCNEPPSHFPEPWGNFVGSCSRWTAIEGLAWAMFALSVIGFFYTIIDRYNFTTKRSNVYDIEAPHEELHESESH
ncbi:hypothetical protein JCM24511_01405 [Saitozyma sp. JCM 24511]|nr:hypothetical protein JCM24511_01405 [Saitozyma sp. JCM 24511]